MQCGHLGAIVHAAENAVRVYGDSPSAPPLLDALRTLAQGRSEGNARFGRQNYKAAITAYTWGLDKAREAAARDSEGARSGEELPGAALLFCNRAACFAKLGDHSAAVADAKRALKASDDYHKARMRLAAALFELGEHEDAAKEYGTLREVWFRWLGVGMRAVRVKRIGCEKVGTSLTDLALYPFQALPADVSAAMGSYKARKELSKRKARASGGAPAAVYYEGPPRLEVVSSAEGYRTTFHSHRDVCLALFTHAHCLPAARLRPVLEKLSVRFPEVLFMVVDRDGDADMERLVEDNLDVDEFPTVRFYDGRRPRGELVHPTPDDLRQTLADVVQRAEEEEEEALREAAEAMP